MPLTRGSCYMDLCCCDYVPPINFKDVWQPFMRIGNSYNKRVKLSCRLGFCNRDSHDRVIFSEMKIDLDSVHEKGAKKKMEGQLHRKFSNIKEFELLFYRRLLLLSKYYFPKKDVLALYCRVFSVSAKATDETTNNIREHNHAIVKSVIHATKEYFTKNGENAYSAFCVLTACASHPISWFSPEQEIDKLQSKIGEWGIEFSEKVKDQEFNIDDYIDDRSREAAIGLYRDYVAQEKFERRVPDNLFGNELIYRMD